METIEDERIAALEQQILNALQMYKVCVTEKERRELQFFIEECEAQITQLRQRG